MLEKGSDSIKSFQTPGDLLKIYKEAFEAAGQDFNPDIRIKAYDKVINYCSGSEACLIDSSVKRNMVLYWTYNNLGDAWLQRGKQSESATEDGHNYRNAISYYREAVTVAVDRDEKVISLRKIASIYKHIGDVENLRKVGEEIVDHLDDEHKRMSYMKLADIWKGTYKNTKFLEKALDFVNKEDVSLLDKCQNTLQICEMLLNNYKEIDDKENIKRINRLLNKTALIVIRDLEEKIVETSDRETQLDLYAKMLELVNRYCLDDSGFKMKAIQKIVNSIEDGEVLSLEKLLL